MKPNGRFFYANVSVSSLVCNLDQLALSEMARTNRAALPQLVLKEILLVSGGEWSAGLPGWTFIRVARGMGYWVHPSTNYELVDGTVLVLSELVRGSIRCSQLNEMALEYFYVQPKKLSGILSLSEQRVLEEVRHRRDYLIRVIPHSNPVAELFHRVCEIRNERAPISRLHLLDLFIRFFDHDLLSANAMAANEEAARARLEGLLKELHPADLLELSSTDLAGKVGCSPRHLARIFQQVTGVSFKKTQTQLRLANAQELLRNTNSKVLDVALESGYQSLSLFNLMFKRRFGLTPGEWRKKEILSPSALFSKPA